MGWPLKKKLFLRLPLIRWWIIKDCTLIQLAQRILHFDRENNCLEEIKGAITMYQRVTNNVDKLRINNKLNGWSKRLHFDRKRLSFDANVSSN